MVWSTNRDIIAASKTERLQPRFLQKNTPEGIPGNMVAKYPHAPFALHETTHADGSVPFRYGRRKHTGLSDRFPKG